MNEAEFAIVGGGPAGATLAAHLARTGHETVVFERLAHPRWRACGVYSSPLTRRRLLDAGLPQREVDELIRPISAMVVSTVDGKAACRLEYGRPHACGIDRVRLERRLLALARREGASVHEGTPVIGIELDEGLPSLTASGRDGAQSWRVRVLVGADGPGSLVARSAGVALAGRRYRRAALTVHRADPQAAVPGAPMEAEMVLGSGWYCGIAPVPGNRVNLGLVVAEGVLRRELARPGGLAGIIRRRLDQLPGPSRPWSRAHATDGIRAALPLAHRVRRVAGANFLLVGDAAGFVDPLSGEGLGRSLASAELAAVALDRWAGGRSDALHDYERRLRARYGGKDVLSWLLQAFVTTPALAGVAVRNLARRPELARDFGLALADLLPSTRVLNPWFVARLLAP